MDNVLAQSYAYCRRVAKTRAGNFYYGFLLLPPAKRDALCAIYAFMRRCDDLSDDALNPLVAGAQLADFRRALVAALADEAGVPQALHPPELWTAFVDTVRKYEIPAEHFHKVIDGAEMDLTINRYETFEDLYHYCYCVASAVGLACIRVFGCKGADACKPAEHMGIAFQLTNILRDVKEDAARNRIYLPREDMAQFGVTETDVLQGRWSERFAQLLSFQAERAESYYTRAQELLPLVEPQSRAAVAAMARIYHGILRKIQQPGFNVFERRARLTTAGKLCILARALQAGARNSRI